MQKNAHDQKQEFDNKQTDKTISKIFQNQNESILFFNN